MTTADVVEHSDEQVALGEAQRLAGAERVIEVLGDPGTEPGARRPAKSRKSSSTEEPRRRPATLSGELRSAILLAVTDPPSRTGPPPLPPRLSEPLTDARHETLDPRVEWDNERIEGDLTGHIADHVEITASALHGVRLTGARLENLRLVDVLTVDCELSGAIITEASLQRVEFVNCRMSGLVISDTKLRHVRFRDCKLDDANFRFVKAERAAFDGCSLVDADFSNTAFTSSAFAGCDLRTAEFSKASMKGTRLAGSNLEGLRGASSFRGAVVGTDQVLPLALGVFADLGIVIDDEAE